MRRWRHYLAPSRSGPHTCACPCLSDQQIASQTRRQKVWRNPFCRKTWVKLPTGRGDDCSEQISCISWPSAASTVTQHLLLHLLPLFFPFPSFLTFTSLPHFRHVWSADEAAWITSEHKPLKLNQPQTILQLIAPEVGCWPSWTNWGEAWGTDWFSPAA